MLARYRPLVEAQSGDWEGFITALQRPLPTCVWARTGRIDRDRLAELIDAEEAVDHPLSVPVGWNPAALRLPAGFRAGQRWWYCVGLAHAQEEASQLPVTLLDVQPGQRVLDLCAAPGGKTAQIALAMDNRGTLIANDFARERMAALQGNLDRLGILNCSTTWADGGNFPAAAGTFDRVLVDAPCSSEGTLRRHPSLAERLNPDAIADNRRLQGRQLALLRKAVQLCRLGGRILYSTCTFAPEENEFIVARLLDEYDGGLRLVPAAVAGLHSSPGVTAWNGRQLDASLRHALRLWPHLSDTGGFFVAVLEKTADAARLSPTPSLGLPDDSAGTADAVGGTSLASDDLAWLPALGEHYGLPERLWQTVRAHRQTRRGLHLHAADHRPPAAPKTEGRGLFFYRTNIRPPKLTTAGALAFGHLADRQVVELDAEQRDAYLRRASVTPRAPQCAHCRPGQVIVRYLGHSLGVALLTRSGTLESLFPSRWSGCAGGGGASEAQQTTDSTRI